MYVYVYVYVYIYMCMHVCVCLCTCIYVQKEGPEGFSVIHCHLSSVVKSAALKKSGYPQVPVLIPAENTSTQIHMDLSK